MTIIRWELVLMIGCASAQAQQVPQAAFENASRVTSVAVLPGSSNDGLSGPSLESELAGLVRAQTDAIKTLSDKLDDLEKRIERLEASERP